MIEHRGTGVAQGREQPLSVLAGKSAQHQFAYLPRIASQRVIQQLAGQAERRHERADPAHAVDGGQVGGTRAVHAHQPGKVRHVVDDGRALPVDILAPCRTQGAVELHDAIFAAVITARRPRQRRQHRHAVVQRIELRLLHADFQAWQAIDFVVAVGVDVDVRTVVGRRRTARRPGDGGQLADRAAAAGAGAGHIGHARPLAADRPRRCACRHVANGLQPVAAGHHRERRRRRPQRRHRGKNGSCTAACTSHIHRQPSWTDPDRRRIRPSPQAGRRRVRRNRLTAARECAVRAGPGTGTGRPTPAPAVRCGIPCKRHRRP